MARVLQIAIVGYGIAGIAAAIRFRRLGHRITHFDRNDPPATTGAGMLLHPPAQRQLQQLGMLTEAMACGAQVARLSAQTARGKPLMDIGYADFVSGQFGLGIQRGTLHRLLKSADDGRDEICSGRQIVSIDPYEGYLIENPEVRHGPYDLMIIADGANSLLRNKIQTAIRYDKHGDSAAVVGLLDDPDRISGDHLVQYYDGARHLSVWPVGCESAEESPKCSIAMNVSIAEAATFRDQGTWRNLVAQLCPAISRLVNNRVRNSSLHIFTYRDVELDQYAVGRAVLIGDAAHSMSPQLGNGAQLAMEDAAILATAVEQHAELSRALQAYAHDRPLQLRRYQHASRWLTPLFQSNSQMLALLRDKLFANTMKIQSVKRLAHTLLC
jgi:FAD-dependent urate hydroxylase